MRHTLIYVLFILITILFFAFSSPPASGSAGPYDHLYFTGHFKPGSPITGKIVGAPGTQPVGLILGTSLFGPPLNSMWGDFYVNSFLLFGPLGSIPASGVIELPANLPMTPGPYNLYIQALIGNELSNLFVMEVRDAAPSGMVMVPGGEYEMGDHHDGLPDAKPVHKVNINSFLMDIHEVTNQQYCDFLNSAYSQGLIDVSGGVAHKKNGAEEYCDTTSSSIYSRITWNNSVFGVTKGKSNHPMTRVSWYGAAAYANWRSSQYGLKPCYNLKTWECDFKVNGYRLPTEAEWEKAARGGEFKPYYRYPWGDAINGSNANYANSGDPYENGNPPDTTPKEYYCGSQLPLGADMANGYGLYDMAGNIWEWCNDWYDSSYYKYCVNNGIQSNPKGPSKGSERVLRGGSWVYNQGTLECARRTYHLPKILAFSFGFRLVRNP